MRELGDEAVLLHLATETYFGLDELAEHGLVEIDAP